MANTALLHLGESVWTGLLEGNMIAYLVTPEVLLKPGLSG